MPDSKAAQNSAAEKIKNYSINLMWINSCPCEDREEDLIKFQYIIKPAVQWAEANPEAKVYLWYDSEHLWHDSEHPEKTSLNDAKESLKSLEISNIEFKDVREIPIVKDNPDTFSSGIPIYFRVDLLKLIILLHSIEHDGIETTIYSDAEVGRKNNSNVDKMNKEELFPDEVVDKLHKTGFVYGLNSTPTSNRPENQFLQLYNNPLMSDSIRMIININISFIINELNSLNEKPWLNIGTYSEHVYRTMYNVYDIYYALQCKAKLYWKDELSSRRPGYKDTGDEKKDLEAYEKKTSAWEGEEFHRSKMKEFLLGRDGYYSLNAFPKYFMDDQDIPIKTPLDFRSNRKMSREDKPGEGHGGTKWEISSPQNGKEYCCVFSQYKTKEAGEMLGFGRTSAISALNSSDATTAVASTPTESRTPEVTDKEIVLKIIKEAGLTLPDKMQIDLNKIIKLANTPEQPSLFSSFSLFSLSSLSSYLSHFQAKNIDIGSSIKKALENMGMQKEDLKPGQIDINKIRNVVGEKISEENTLSAQGSMRQKPGERFARDKK